MSAKRLRKKKNVDIEVPSSKKKKKEKMIKISKRKEAIDLPAVVSHQILSRNMDCNSSLSIIFYRLVKELFKNAFKNHLKFKLSGSSSMTPVINIPVSVHSSELMVVLPLLKKQEFQLFGPQKKGFSLSTWVRTDEVLNELCYKLDITGDFVIICPIGYINVSLQKCFVIREVDLYHYSVFIPMKSSIENVEVQDPSVVSPFGLGLSLKGSMLNVAKSDVGTLSTISIASSSSGKLEISGKLSKFSKSGYFIYGMHF